MQKNNGFTLIELSIVVVIIGLIAGGILIGLDMIRAAELRTVTRDYTKFKTAILMFKDTYDALPGDMDNATTFWSGVNNGNDNNIYLYQESFQSWLHLQKAELIEGNYTGLVGPDHATWDAVIGSNVPASEIDGVGFFITSLVWDNGWYELPALSGVLPGDYDYLVNQIIMGKETGNLWTGNAFLTPTELWNIDTKMDDGKPGTGIIIAASYVGCIDAGDQFAAASSTPVYNKTNDDITCAIIFMPEGTGL